MTMILQNWFLKTWTQKHQKVLHEVVFMIVGQDAGNIPVSRGQGLKDICTSVWLNDNSTINTQTSKAKG